MLEQFFKVQWIEKKYHSIFIAFFYSLIAIFSAYLIIPSHTGLVSLALTSIILLPSLNALLKEEENVEIRENKFNLFILFKDHFDIIKVYIFIFFGVFFAYLIVPLILGQNFSSIYFQDLLRISGFVGKATSAEIFSLIFFNNLKVLLAVFILSLVYGAGSIFYLTLNGGIWGMFFGMAFATHNLSVFFSQLSVVLPHTILEALGYILIAIAGGVLSKAVLREKVGSKAFKHVFTDALILSVLSIIVILLAGVVETIVIAYFI